MLVEVRAAGINPGEAGIRTGALHEQFPATFPSGEGSDLAGVVLEVGDGVSDFAVGDEVLGFSFQRSSHATHTSVPVDQLIHKPAELSWEVAGSLYVVGVTAYAAVARSRRRPGETVAVSAAAGGVGSLVVQLLALRGVRVLGIASAGNAEWLRAHGVEPVDYGDGLARPTAGGRTRRHRRLHRPVRAGLRAARRRPRCATRADQHDHLVREGRRGRRENRRQCRGVDPGGAAARSPI